MRFVRSHNEKSNRLLKVKCLKYAFEGNGILSAKRLLKMAVDLLKKSFRNKTSVVKSKAENILEKMNREHG